MTARPVLLQPDPRLRLRSAPVTSFDADLKRLAAELTETLEQAGGIALSAPQIDEPLRVLVMTPSQEAAAPRVYVNPTILAKKRWGVVEESCLSVPGVVGNVLRATEVHVRAQDLGGAEFERRLTGMDAVCLQHETDHLDGVLFIDRLSIFRRLRLRLKADAAARRRRNAA